MILLLACAAPEPQLTVTPERVDFGEVSFLAEMPEGGFATADLTYENTGDTDATLTLLAYDTDHLCVEGFAGDSDQKMTTMGPGSTFLLPIGVCGYVQGEATTLVETELVVVSDVLPAELVVDITFTPIRVNE